MPLTMPAGSLLLLVGLLLTFGAQQGAAVSAAQQFPVKPGMCPTPIETNYVMCGRFCAADDNCPGNERCCLTRCGHQCLLPTEISNGYCPRVTDKPDQSKTCVSNCSSDTDCRGGWDSKKCCQFGCQRKCVNQEEEHPGVCPKRQLVYTFVPCNSSCHDDRDCPLAQKCCFTGCRRGCVEPVRRDLCQFPAEPGSCQKMLGRYFYSPEQKTCRAFRYSGCKGNSNNFKTVEECEKVCGKISPEVCKLPKDPGPCLAYMPSFYYNSVTKTCETFIYGGCKGNGNRFASRLECVLVCGGSAKPSSH